MNKEKIVFSADDSATDIVARILREVVENNITQVEMVLGGSNDIVGVSCEIGDVVNENFATIPAAIYEGVVGRLKILAGEEGGWEANILDKAIKIKISIMMESWGEKVVMKFN